MSLKIKLAISYLLLSLFLVGALLITANYFLEEEFQSYIMESQEQKNLNYVDLVAEVMSQDGEILSEEILLHIGHTALQDGMVLMVNDVSHQELFCISTANSVIYDTMLESMQSQMESIYPGFKGEYVEKNYEVMKSGTKVATVTLGYYGPFYYNDADVQFLQVLNRVFLIVAIIFLILAIAFGFFMAEKIAGPIRRVIHKTKEIEDGNYENRLEFKSKTREIDQLIHSVNSLAETLHAQQNQKKRLAKDYAHELRTPLTTIQSNLEAMIDKIWEPTPERMESCREEVVRLTRMISEIEKIDRIESDTLQLKKTEFDLDELIQQVLITFQPEINAKKLSANMELAACKVWADQDKIKQVLINLVSNAVKYSKEGGSLEISIAREGNMAKFMIKDTGIGISKEDLPHIFEHLYRADKSRNRSTGGSGIGLAIASAIIEAHGGKIYAESVEGVGSLFFFTIPR